MGIAQVLLGSIKEISTGNHRFIWPGECREDHSVRGASNPHQDHHRERGLEQSEAHGKVPPSIFPSNCRYVMIYCIHIHTHTYIYIYTHTYTHTHFLSIHLIINQLTCLSPPSSVLGILHRFPTRGARSGHDAPDSKGDCDPESLPKQHAYV